MAKAKTTVTIEGKAAEKLAELAAASGRSEAFYAAYIIEEYAARELHIIGEMKAAAARVANGEGIPHEEAVRRFRATIDRARRPAAE
jgi:predicted transcriptional regulator